MTRGTIPGRTATRATPAPIPRWTVSPPAPRSQGHPTRHEQATLARRARKGDAASREAMVLRNQRLVYAVTHRYTGRGLELDDLAQEGMVGLIKAVDRFDPDRGVAFSTYAVWWIHQSIRRALDRASRLIRIPSHLGPAAAAVHRAAAELGGSSGLEPDLNDIAATTGLDPETCHALLRAIRTPASVHASVRPNRETRLVGDLLVDLASPDPEAACVRDAVREHVRRLLSLLEPREYAVIRAGFGIDGEPVAVNQIAKQHRVSAERIRQIQARALAKLRRAALLVRFDTLAEDADLR